MCEVDWSNLIGLLGALASILTAVIAWLAFAKWKNPKISELKSQEAKNLFTKIQEFRSEFVSIRNDMADPQNENKDFSSEIVSLHNTLISLYAQDRLLNYLIGNGAMIENQSSGQTRSRTKIQNTCISYLKKIDKFNLLPFHSRLLDTDFLNVITNFDKDSADSIKCVLKHFNYGRDIDINSSKPSV